MAARPRTGGIHFSAITELHKHQCIRCGCFHPRQRFSGRGPNRMHYRALDDKGKHWWGNTCPPCQDVKRKIQTYHSKKPKDPTQERAKSAEMFAFFHFTKLGYYVEMCKTTGPDLKIYKNGVWQTVEVKMAIEKKDSKDCWFIQPVQPLRVRDDFIAIVFLGIPAIYVEKMEDHLKKCPKSGLRAVTELIRNRRWVGAPECSQEDREIAKSHISRVTLKHGRYATWNKK